MIYTKIFETLIFPPGLFIFFLVLSVLVIKNIKLLKYFLLIQIIIIYLFSIHLSSYYLFSFLETIPALTDAQIQKNNSENNVDAIVVLAGGISAYTKEYHGVDVGSFTQLRLRYAAWLQKKTHLPIIVTGGLEKNGMTESELMKKLLQNEYMISAPIFIENKSQSTYENAVYSHKILDKEGFDSFYLITNAFHMSRALAEFKKYNYHIVAAPMGFYIDQADITSDDFLPGSSSLQKNNFALHEIIGSLWYQILDLFHG